MDTLLTLPQIEKWFLLTLGIQMKLMQRIYQVISKFYSLHFLHIYAKDEEVSETNYRSIKQ